MKRLVAVLFAVCALALSAEAFASDTSSKSYLIRSDLERVSDCIEVREFYGSKEKKSYWNLKSLYRNLTVSAYITRNFSGLITDFRFDSAPVDTTHESTESFISEAICRSFREQLESKMKRPALRRR